MESTFCLRCRRLLAAESASGMCPTCLGSAPTGPPDRVAVVPASPTRPAVRPTSTLTANPTPRPDDHPTDPNSSWPRRPAAPPGYELLDDLGAGGMGSVYLAREHATERTVAMKFLHGPARPSALERFLVEVRALARLNHPNIVRVLAVDTQRPDPYFTMEYAAGGSLAKLVERSGPLPPADAAGIMATVARAIHAAHAADVLHRDLKPSNILLAGDRSGDRGQGTGDSKTGRTPGSSLSPVPCLLSPELSPVPCLLSPELSPVSCPLSPVVADFGLAKRLDRDDALTHGTGALGTPNFMPPEQAGSGEVGPRSDVYGLGATLYYLLTGRPPHTGDGADIILRLRAGTDPPRPRSVRPDLPADLEGIVVKCLERDPVKRYATAAELADDLDRFLAGEEPVAPALTRRRRTARWARRHRRWLVGLAAACGVAAGLFIAGRQFPTDPPVGPGVVAADPHVEIHHLLRGGAPKTLLGRTGLPVWSEWPLGSTKLVPAPEAEGACSFAAIDGSLLELVRDPGVERYAFSADLRILDRPAAGASTITEVGLYFGYAAPTAGNGLPAHTFLILGYSDYLPPEARPAKITVASARLRAVGVTSRPNERATTGLGGWSGTRITFPPANPPAGGLLGEWRRVRVEVTPDGIDASWAAGPDAPPTRFRRLTPDETGLPFRDAEKPLGKQCREAGVVAPPWQPRMPLGVWCRGAAVALRNVVIEPLP